MKDDRAMRSKKKILPEQNAINTVDIIENDFKDSVRDFMLGDATILENKEYIDKLPYYLMRLFQSEDQSEANLLLDRLGEYILATKTSDGEKGLNAIDVINNYLLVSKQTFETRDGKDFLQAVKGFQKGKNSLLQDREFTQKLPHHILMLCQNQEDKSVYLILDRLGECVLRELVTEREKALIVLAVTNNLAIASNNIVLLKTMFKLLLKWLEFETVYLVGFPVICQQFHRITQVLVRYNQRHEVCELLNLINKIENGVIEKNEIIRNMICSVREQIVGWENESTILMAQANTENPSVNYVSKPACKQQMQGDFEIVLRKFAGGDDTALLNQEFFKKLPHYIYEMYDKDIDPESLSLLKRLEECIQGRNLVNREKGLGAIRILNTLSLASKNLGLMQRLFRLLVKWLETETVFIVDFTDICNQLQQIGIELMGNDFRQEAQLLLEVTCRIKEDILINSNDLPS